MKKKDNIRNKIFKYAETVPGIDFDGDFITYNGRGYFIDINRYILVPVSRNYLKGGTWLNLEFDYSDDICKGLPIRAYNALIKAGLRTNADILNNGYGLWMYTIPGIGESSNNAILKYVDAAHEKMDKED